MHYILYLKELEAELTPAGSMKVVSSDNCVRFLIKWWAETLQHKPAFRRLTISYPATLTVTRTQPCGASYTVAIHIINETQPIAGT